MHQDEEVDNDEFDITTISSAMQEEELILIVLTL